MDRKEDSLKKRYIFKLITNLVTIPVALVTETLVPRALGPALYGSFSFLNNFFNQILAFFNVGTATAFYTKLSQRQKEAAIVRFYWLFSCLIFLFLFLFVFVVQLSDSADFFWPEQEMKYVWLAVFWSLLFWITQNMQRMLDAYGITRHAELIKSGQKLIGLLFLIALYFFNYLTLTTFFYYHYVLFLLLILGWNYVLIKNGFRLFPRQKISRKQTKSYINEFYTYSAPLIVFAFITLIAGILDRWLLQKFAGSHQQGYFALSFQISTFCFLFAQAMSPLIMREFTIAFKKKDFEEMRNLFSRYVPMLYSIVAYFSVFLSLQAEKVGYIVGGEKFAGASLAITIMALYPIHQTYGQLSSSVFYATGQTKLFRNIGIFTNIAGLLLIFLFIAPPEYLGFDLGALGLAVKMVLIQFIGVNVGLWFNCKFLNMSFFYYFLHQIYSVALFFVAAYAAKYIIDNFIASNIFVDFIISGIIYTVLVMIIALIFPKQYATSHNEIKEYVYKMMSKIR